MRYLMILSFLTLLQCHDGQAQVASTPDYDDEEQAVLAVVTDFLSAGDAQDTSRLVATLHPTFRIAINQFMGGPDVMILERPTYLSMIEDKKLGGDPRTAVTKSVELVGNLAFVRAVVENSTLRFDTAYTLAKDTNGRWWLIAETPFVTPIP